MSEENKEVAIVDENKEYIINNLQSKLDWLKANTDYNVIGIFLRGSQNYDLDIQTTSYESDIDAVAIIVPSLEGLITGGKMTSKEIVMEDGSHIDVKDIRCFNKLFYKANASILEILYTEYKIVCDESINELWDMADDICKMNKGNMLACLKGTIHQRRKSLATPNESTEKYGYDLKQLHHMMRYFFLMRDVFLMDCPLCESLKPDSVDRAYLLELKTEPLSLDNAIELADTIVRCADEACERILQDNIFKLNEVTFKKMKDVIFNIVKDKVKK